MNGFYKESRSNKKRGGVDGRTDEQAQTNLLQLLRSWGHNNE